MQDGGIYYMTSALAIQTTDSDICQMVTAPLTMSMPTLSFLYELGGASAVSGAGLSVIGKTSVTMPNLFTKTASAYQWSHAWIDLRPWSGQTVALTFNVNQAAGGFHSW